MLRNLLIMLLMAGITGVALPQESRDSGSSLSVVELLARLGSADFALRRQASEELIRRGEGVALELKEARGALPLEARMRVDGILERISRADAAVSTELKPTLVTLSLNNQPLPQVLEALGASGGLQLRAAPQGAVPRTRQPPEPVNDAQIVSLEVENVPFFKALDRLCQDSGLVFRRDARTRIINLTPGPPSIGPIIYPGPFRAEIRSFSVTRQRLSSGDVNVRSYMQIQIDVEREAQILGILSPLTAEVIEDDKGRSLLPDVVTNRAYLMPAANNLQFNLSIMLQPPERDAERIRRLLCPLRIVVKTEVANARLMAPFAKGQVPSRESALKLRLDQLEVTGELTKLTISFARIEPEGEAPAGARIASVPTMTFSLASGEEVKPTQLRRYNKQDRSSLQVTLPTKELAELRVQAVLGYATQSIALEFQDLKIP